MRAHASIVVLSYNELEATTKPCLESVLKNTQPGSYELILVDNASSDGTRGYIQELARKHSHIKVCVNDTNKGYAGGNNDGMQLASGRFLVLLNNDTLVPPGWLDALLAPLIRSKDIGLIGPVTNSAGNEQRIELRGLNEANYEAIAGAYTDRQKGMWFRTEKLGFFCVAMRRSLVDEIGHLDERFGIGMFEDDDYCIRVKKAGYKLIVVEDCFVFHKGSVSFGKLAVAAYQTLFEKNKNYFLTKHGIPWTLSDIAFGYWEKMNKDFQLLAANSRSQDPALERISLRLENFRHLLVQIHSAESRAQPGEIPQALSSIALRAKWKTRWFNFQRHMINGTPTERWRYTRSVAGRLIGRLSRRGPTTPHHQAIAALEAIRQQAGGNKIVVIPATIDFTYMRQRPQQLAEALAEAGYLVIYGTLNHQTDSVALTHKVRDGLFLVNERIFTLFSHVFHPEDVWYYCLWPNNIKHLDYLPCHKVIYDFMDDLALLDLPKEQVDADHRSMLDRADAITVSATRLLESLPASARQKALLLPNAVSDAFIEAVALQTPIPQELLPATGRKIIGYYGAIAEWVDFDLVERLSRELRGVFLVMIGPVAAELSERILKITEGHRNVLVLPPRPQLELIPFLQRFDVCIIPFVRNEITDAVSPVKLYEYLGAGKPVVSTDLPECRQFNEVCIATTHDHFLSGVRQYLEGDASGAAVARKQLAQQNTWRDRVRQIESRLTPPPSPENRLAVSSAQAMGQEA